MPLRRKSSGFGNRSKGGKKQGRGNAAAAGETSALKNRVVTKTDDLISASIWSKNEKEHVELFGVPPSPVKISPRTTKAAARMCLSCSTLFKSAEALADHECIVTPLGSEGEVW